MWLETIFEITSISNEQYRPLLLPLNALKYTEFGIMLGTTLSDLQLNIIACETPERKCANFRLAILFSTDKNYSLDTNIKNY